MERIKRMKAEARSLHSQMTEDEKEKALSIIKELEGLNVERATLVLSFVMNATKISAVVNVDKGTETYRNYEEMLKDESIEESVKEYMNNYLAFAKALTERARKLVEGKGAIGSVNDEAIKAAEHAVPMLQILVLESAFKNQYKIQIDGADIIKSVQTTIRDNA